MSDQSQGPGWWRASNDKWYPPEQHPDYRAPQAPAPPPASAPERQPQSRAEAKADAKAAAARARALRPWYKKKRIMIPLVLVALIVIGGALGAGGDDDEDPEEEEVVAPDSGGDESDDTTPTTEERPDLYPERPNRQREDQERQIGQDVRLSGYTAVVNSAEYRPSLSVIQEDGYLVINVTVSNRDEDPQPYNTFDWQLLFPAGTIQDPTFASSGDQIESGDLVQGGTVTGEIAFEIGDTRGDFYILYKPDPFDAARGVWKVNIP